MKPSTQSAAVPAVCMSMFPVMGSTKEVMDFAQSKFPINSTNEMHALFKVYHNTMLIQSNPIKE
jgi:hypothetical protein